MTPADGYLPLPAPGAPRARHLGLAADNPIRAQRLVRELMAANPALLTAGMHCVPPGLGVQTIVASTLNVIGKPSDPPDVGVGHDGETILSPNLRVPKLGIMLPLRDAAGRDIGALALAFRYRAGEDQVAYLAQATAIRDHLAARIPGLPDLFVPEPPVNNP